MKVLLISKRNIKNIIIIFFIFNLCIFLYITTKNKNILEVSTNSEETNMFYEKIKNLTKGEEKIAYLTFDDGPTISVTPKVLKILEEENIKATFFVVGKNVEKYPEIVKEAYEKGHYIANHGYDHINKNLYKSEESFIEEVEKTDKAIGEAIGIENYCAKVFRFPNGYMSSQNKKAKESAALTLKKMNYTYIDWNCLNNDSIKKYSNNQLLNNLKKSAKNKKTLVILMHDTKDVNDSSKVLKKSINYLREQGYKFENFYNLL